MIDLHCHLLPGIDDGPATVTEALVLCRIALADGITHAVVTPHIHPGRWANTRASIARDCARLQHQLSEQNIPLQLGFAAEVRLTEQIMQQVENDEIPFYGTVDDYRIMLLEFPHGHIVPGSEKLAAWLLERNIRPLIAHPERNRQVMKNPEHLRPFIEAGCWLQLTAGSLAGSFGERAEATARLLLEQDSVTVLASDGHNGQKRKPALSMAYGYVREHFGDERARRLFFDNPVAITAGQFGGGIRDPAVSAVADRSSGAS